MKVVTIKAASRAEIKVADSFYKKKKKKYVLEYTQYKKTLLEV